MDQSLLECDEARHVAKWRLRPSSQVVALLATGCFAALCCVLQQPPTAGLLMRATPSPPFKNWKCSDAEWQEFLQKFSLNDHGEGYVSNWPSFRDRGPCADRNVLWLWPRFDHNGAFKMDSRACYRLMHWYPRACSVTVINTSSVQDAERVLREFPDRSLMLADLGGHGNPNTLVWGNYSSVPDGTACIPDKALPVYGLEKPDTILGSLRVGQMVYTSGPLKVADGRLFQPLQSGGMAQVNFLSCGIYTLDKAPASESFLRLLRSKVYRDGSVVLDSCSTGAPNPSGAESLIQFVANALGDGIRVFAAVEPLDTTDVVDFDSYYPLFNGKDPLMMEHGARCPEWASAPRPDGNDDCSCPAATECVSVIAVPNTTCLAERSTPLFASLSSQSVLRTIEAGMALTAAGQPQVVQGRFMLPVFPSGAVYVSDVRCPTSKACPRSMGLWSSSRFLPSCGDKWSRIQCGCVSSHAKRDS